MIRSMNILVFLLLSPPLLLEGIGMKIPREYFLLYYLFIPFLFIPFTLHQSALRIPPLFFICTLLYICAVNIASFFFSLDKQVSIYSFFFYCSLILIFIFFYNHQKQTRRFLPYIILFFNVLFIAYSLCIPYFQSHNLKILMPFMEKQVVFPTYSPHNHLGDFLGLGLVVLLIKSISTNRFMLWTGFFILFIFFILSFSRSSYVAFGVVFILFLFFERKKIGRSYLLLGSIVLSVLLIILAISSSRLSKTTSSLDTLSTTVNTVVQIIPRDLISQRNVFAQQALFSAQKYPFGIGAGNFVLASLRYNWRNDISDSAHNIFLEQLAENGIPATIFIIMLATLLVVNALRFPSLPGYLFLYLLVNFQTDYTYQIYIFSIFATILTASFYYEKKEIHISVTGYVLPTLLLSFIATQILLSNYLTQQNRFQEALTINPLNKLAYIGALQQSKYNEPLIKQALSIAPYDIGITLAAINQYMKNGQKMNALELYERAFDANHLLNFGVVKELYFLKREVRGTAIAQAFLKRIIFIYKRGSISEEFRKEINAFCKKVGIKECKKAGWRM